MMRTLAAALLLATPLPAQAATAQPPQAAPVQGADRLVALLVSDESIVPLAGQLFDAHVGDDANLPAEQRAMFAADPALKQQVATSVRNEMAGVLRQELPGLRSRLAVLVGKEMTRQEIADSLAFFSTATGRKLMSGAYRAVGESGATSEAEAEKAAMAAVMRNLSPEDYSPLLTFGSSTAAQKFQTLRPRINEVSRRWGEEVVTRHQARLERTAERAIASYRGKTK